jgi:hypothetical protein
MYLPHWVSSVIILLVCCCLPLGRFLFSYVNVSVSLERGFFFFLQYWSLNQSFTLARQTLPFEPLLQSCFVIGFFELSSHELFVKAGFKPQTSNPLISASQVARIISVSHHQYPALEFCRVGGVAQEVECLPSKCEAPSSNPSATHKTKQKNRKSFVGCISVSSSKLCLVPCRENRHSTQVKRGGARPGGSPHSSIRKTVTYGWWAEVRMQDVSISQFLPCGNSKCSPRMSSDLQMRNGDAGVCQMLITSST